MRCRISANWQRSNCIRAGDRRSPLQQTGCAANAPNIGTSILPRTARADDIRPYVGSPHPVVGVGVLDDPAWRTEWNAIPGRMRNW